MATPGETLDFLVIGVGKSGTTTLAELLARHPDVAITRPKEPWFFDSADFERGMQWYWHRYLTHYAGEPRVGEASSQTLFVPYAAQRLYSVLPRAKLLALFRDPVERAHSDWWMKYCTGLERDDFATAIAKNLEQIRDGLDFADPAVWQAHLDAHRSELRYKTYLQYGNYAGQLQRFLDYFPREQMLLLRTLDLAADQAGTMATVCEFLQVDPQQQPGDGVPLVSNPSRSPRLAGLRRSIRAAPVVGPTLRGAARAGRPLLSAGVRRALRSGVRRIDRGEKPPLSPGLRAQLEDYYRDEMRRFESLTGLVLRPGAD